jgi:putative two-component system response regulator
MPPTPHNINNPIIFVVDDTSCNLELVRVALPDDWEVFLLPSAAKMFKVLARRRPDLIILDIQMPEMDGFEALAELRNSPRNRDLPVLLFSSTYNDPATVAKGLQLGATDFLVKPMAPKLLRRVVDLHLSIGRYRRRVENQAEALERNAREIEALENDFEAMVERRRHQADSQKSTILDTVSKLVDYRLDSNVCKGGRSHQVLAVMIGALQERGLYQEQMADWDPELILQSARLHDVGKLALSGEILAKPGKLTSGEYEQVKLHPVLGGRILAKVESKGCHHAMLKYAKVLAETHQERWDGTGYPAGLAGEDIPLPGRLMAINSVYHALTTERPWKKAMSHDEAVRVIVEGRGTHFDPALVNVFAEVADRLRTGTA